jgi:small-conductance mechanosensitive channel
MNDERHQQAKELARLEQAAEEASEPEQIEQRAAQPGHERVPKAGRRWFLPYLIGVVIAGGLILFLDWRPTLLPSTITEKILRYLGGSIAVVAVLALAKAVELYVISRLRNTVSRFNLRRIVRLIVTVLLVFIVVSVLFVNWYAAAVSLGLISLILGFALQTPISSFIGWIYILARAPYRVGDRIEIGEARGDVIDVSYLDTTLWEIGGRHLSTDHPSGRIIKFPNTNVFTTPVFNYSWPLFPYVWDEVRFEIAYESDLEFVATAVERITREELGESMIEKVKLYRALIGRTPVNDLEVQERPVVLFRANPNTWL